MLRHWTAFTLSLMIHLCVIGSLVFWLRLHDPNTFQVSLPVVLLHEFPRSSPLPETKTNLPISGYTPSPDGCAPVASESFPLFEGTGQSPPFDFIQQEKIRHTLYPRPRHDTPDCEKSPSFVFKKEWISPPPPTSQDPIGELIKKRFMDSHALIPLPHIGASPVPLKTPQPVFDFFPSSVQTVCMARLFASDSLTDTELYPTIDDPISFDAFRKEIERLVEKGWVVKRVVSPQHLFTLFGFPMEMSSQNRRNREYRYRPNVDPQRVLYYLDAKRYELEVILQTHPVDSIEIRQTLVWISHQMSLIRNIVD